MIARWVGLLGAAMALAGCLDDASRYDLGRDTISLSAGEAVEHNMAVQVIDPWPKTARNTNIPLSGERAVRAARRYACGTNDWAARSGGGGGESYGFGQGPGNGSAQAPAAAGGAMTPASTNSGSAGACPQ